MTHKGKGLPPAEVVAKVTYLLTRDDYPIPLPLEDRNWLFARELGERLQAAWCWSVGLKALVVIHSLIERGHPSFCRAILEHKALLTVNLSGLKWVVCQTAKAYKEIIIAYSKYLVDLCALQVLIHPHSLYQAVEDDPQAMMCKYMEMDPETRAKHQQLAKQRSDILFRLLRALTKFPIGNKDAYEEEITSHILKSVFHDSRRLYVMIARMFKNKLTLFRCGSVQMVEKWVHLFEDFYTLSGEVSNWFMELNCFINVFHHPLPTIKPMPRTALEGLKKLVVKAKEQGTANVEDCRCEEPEIEVEKESLADVLKREPETPAGRQSTTSEDTLHQLLSPAGTLDSDSNGSQADLNALGGRKQLYRHFDEDSLADVLTSNNNSVASEDLREEPEDYALLLSASEDERTIMVSATANSESANHRFQLLPDEILGKGGFGVVYKAWDRQEGMYAAVKELSVQPSTVKELFAEFRTQTSLEHENIVRTLMFSLGKNTGRIFMEWVPAGSLHQVLASTKAPFSEKLIRRYVKDVLCGLQYLHGLGIVHRDIKPSNMLLSVGGRVKLTDFGSSRVLAIINNSMKTETLVGTVPFLSPEAVRGTYSAAVDIWAVGCSVVEFLTAQPPWSERGKLDQIAMIFHIGNLQAPNHIPSFPREGLSDELLAFIEMCFVHDPKKRPTATDLLRHPFITSD